MVERGFQPQFTITNAITATLTQIERARGFLDAATLSEDWVRAMGERALVLEAHHTTHIEGTHLTLDQAERMKLYGQAERTILADCPWAVLENRTNVVSRLVERLGVALEYRLSFD